MCVCVLQQKLFEGKWFFKCRNGVNECMKNKWQACSIHVLPPKLHTTLASYLACYMSSTDEILSGYQVSFETKKTRYTKFARQEYSYFELVYRTILFRFWPAVNRRYRPKWPSGSVVTCPFCLSNRCRIANTAQVQNVSWKLIPPCEPLQTFDQNVRLFISKYPAFDITEPRAVSPCRKSKTVGFLTIPWNSFPPVLFVVLVMCKRNTRIPSYG